MVSKFLLAAMDQVEQAYKLILKKIFRSKLNDFFLFFFFFFHFNFLSKTSFFIEVSGFCFYFYFLFEKLLLTKFLTQNHVRQ